MSPLVSVGVVTYNQLGFLKECVSSVIAQDYPNIEIIIGDDGSTDGTREYLHALAKEFPGKIVLIISGTNRGVTANHNEVYFRCRGKYIAWLGGDDIMLPGKIRKQVDFMESNPACAICYHNLEVFDSATGRTIGLFNNRCRPDGGIQTLIRLGTFNGACSTMVRRDSAPASGFNPMLRVASDWLFWCETLAAGGSINYIDEVLGRYRRHAGSVTAQRRRSNNIGQNESDHLVTCILLLVKFPRNTRDVRLILSENIFRIRRVVDYYQALVFSLRLNVNWKALVSLVVYLLTFRHIRL
jgi:glycosyltransferase involved in cell wall biosynthesis